MTGSARLDVELPDGWYCVDLPVPPDRREETFPASGAAAFADWLHDQGAGLALIRPGDAAVPAAICGGVFVVDRLPVAGDMLFAVLDAEGEAVALGDLDGIPIVSHVRREPADDVRPGPMLHITYFVCAPSMCVVMTFGAPEGSTTFGAPERNGSKCVVDEVAKIVSAARVVHSGGGCPV